MNVSRLFILRPVATSLLMMALIITGTIAFRMLPISALPDVDYPTIQVTTLYPGASPEVMTSSVTAPLERQFGQMPGLGEMHSVSSGGASVITLRFSLGLNLDVGEQQVQAAINAASNLLPSDLPTPPIYNKVNPADAPIATIALTSATMPLPKIQDLAETRLSPKLSQLQGVGLVTISGGVRPALRVQANPVALAARGLSLEDLRTAVASGNSNSPKGSFDGPSSASTLYANDQLSTADEYRNLVIGFQNGAATRVSDVAKVVDGAENEHLAGWANELPGIIINIQRQPGANVIAVADRVKELLEQLRTTLPASVQVALLTDRTLTIRSSVEDVEFELVLSIALVVLVIFAFLRSFSATVIPAVAVPLSLIGTFGVMYLCGFSLNNLTLMALTVATGFVVDDAIVMIENITRYIEEGEPPMQAALKGAEQIGFTIISLTFSLIAVLIPLLFMADVVGRLFREFAITLAVSILISAVISLTLTPMLCARLLRHVPEGQEGRFHRLAGRFIDSITAQYDMQLRWVLRHQGLTLLVAIGTMGVTAALYVVVPKGFFPPQDTGLIQGITEAGQSTSFAAMAEHQQALAKQVLADPAVESLSSFIGVDGINNTPNTGRMLINLKPLEVRQVSAQEVSRRLQISTAKTPGISLFLQPLQDLTIDDNVSRTQYQFVVEASDLKTLDRWVPKLVERLEHSKDLADITSDLQNKGLQARIEIDRDMAGRLGVTAAAIDSALYNAFGQRLISTIFTQSGQYRVVLEHAPEFQEGLTALDTLYVPGAGGQQVRLSSIAHVVQQQGPLAIAHLGQFPAATVSFNLAPGHSLGEAVKAVEKAEKDIILPLSVRTSFQGAALAFQAALSNELLLLLAAVVVMYIVLGILYESFIHPITILSTLPSAAIGALLALIVSRTDLGVVAIIGIVLLIGIVKKNAIMMIDFALEAERKNGASPHDAIYQACLLRFRPILMTTMAALLGALPLMLGTGIGAELRRPLGLTMVGGLMVSQVLTLFTTPVIYLAFDRISKRFFKQKAPLPMATHAAAVET